MIIDKLKNAYKYYRLHPGLAKAFEHISNLDLVEMDTGSYEIDKKNIYFIISNKKGRSKEEAQLEFHRNYIDIQLVLNGTEAIGWKSTFDCHRLEQVYDSENDIGFYGDNPSNWIILKPGTFAIFFPEDAHAPMVSEDYVNKAVVKVTV
ncbi:MAG: DUF386 domain-containing protein [Ignavibacteriales bacterium]|nr:MAG: DUF386 domain-containing protein [Ignavibacteriales bacterium]